MKPKLQLALDLTDKSRAIELAKLVSDEVDILEIGTVLAIEAGLDSVREIKQILNEDTVLLADIRIIKAGGKLSKMAYEAGADVVTIISDSTEETFHAVVKEKAKAPNREVLIEINDTYTEQDLEFWTTLGLSHLIFHRGSEITDENEKWSETILEEIKELSEKGFKVYVTGGIESADIKVFEGTPVYGFIIGRSIAGAEDPLQATRDYQDEIAKYFD